MEYFWLGIALIAVLNIIQLFRSKKQELPPIKLPPLPTPQVVVNLRPLEQQLEDLPSKLLQSIQGSVNTKKGVLGELIGYTQLRAEYDRIIPLGNIVDFVAIRFATKDDPGTVDFIDIKTGKSRLSKEQRALQLLIKEKHIDFKKVTVETSATHITTD